MWGRHSLALFLAAPLLLAAASSQPFRALVDVPPPPNESPPGLVTAPASVRRSGARWLSPLGIASLAAVGVGAVPLCQHTWTALPPRCQDAVLDAAERLAPACQSALRRVRPACQHALQRLALVYHRAGERLRKLRLPELAREDGNQQVAHDDGGDSECEDGVCRMPAPPPAAPPLT